MKFQQYKKEEYLNLPDKPGIYKFLNDRSKIIYIGKARDLKKRVSSYFTKKQLESRKTYRLVSEIRKIEFVIVFSEFDALLLENNLIKEFQPKYNILLKDDKSFPSICITDERFPRIYSTRRIDKSRGEYFGPFTSVKAMNGVLDLIRKLHKIRTCKLNLSKQNIRSGKFRVCLEYHIGNCLGPCEGLQEENDYSEDIESAKQILKGDIAIVKRTFKEKMQKASVDLNFELAQIFKDRFEFLEKFQTKSLIVNQKITNTDVFTMTGGEENSLFVNYMKIENGAIINSETVEVTKRMNESNKEVFRFVIFDLRKKYQSTNTEILTNEQVEEWEDIIISQPKIGDKKKLIDLSLKNSIFYKKEKISKEEVKTPNQTVLEILKKDLRLKNLPIHIECFDNSNIHGTNPVASMVCFKNGKPSKSDYRKFNIKTVTGPDDFSSMREVVARRYGYLKKEQLPYPNLIIIDGGKGQLSIALDALKELGLYGLIPIVGIAKKLEEIYYPEDNLPLLINKRSVSLKLIQRIRDEAHRFAITFHRNKRSKSLFSSSLDTIKGIGPKTKNTLLKEFGSIKRLKNSSEKELTDLIGKSKANHLIKAIKKGDL
ncbi:MAG: excinuclease ABC subunit UvrC [Ekhidna sp.]|nr:excinuclease ABC subunit UvrC [Ekhidna sp.]